MEFIYMMSKMASLIKKSSNINTLQIIYISINTPTESDENYLCSSLYSCLFEICPWVKVQALKRELWNLCVLSRLSIRRAQGLPILHNKVSHIFFFDLLNKSIIPLGLYLSETKYDTKWTKITLLHSNTCNFVLSSTIFTIFQVYCLEKWEHFMKLCNTSCYKSSKSVPDSERVALRIRKACHMIQTFSFNYLQNKTQTVHKKKKKKHKSLHSEKNWNFTIFFLKSNGLF